MAASAEPIVFYDILPAPGGCPFAHRAWITLEEKGLPYDHRLVDPANKPQDFKDLFASIVQNTDDTPKVPVIIDGPNKVTESLVVVEYLDAAYPDKGVKLLPTDPDELGKVKLFIELFNSKVQTLWFKLLTSGTQEAVDAGKKELIHNLKSMNDYIKVQGSDEGGDYFLGGRYSYVEAATTSFVKRMQVTLPHFRGIDLVNTADEHGYDRLASWLKAVLDRPSIKNTGLSDEQYIETTKRFVKDIN